MLLVNVSKIIDQLINNQLHVCLLSLFNNFFALHEGLIDAYTFRCSLPGYYFYRFLSTHQYLTMDVCILCGESLNDGRLTVTMRQKECDGVNEASKNVGLASAPFPVKIVVETTAIRGELTRRK